MHRHDRRGHRLSDDGNACTYNDRCDGAGSCVGTTYSCAPSQCQLSGSCLENGSCSFTNKASGATCNDGNACTGAAGAATPDHCDGAGNCAGGTLVTCQASDQCHTAGTCNPSTGACSNPAVANGTTCNDGNGCTKGDSCQNGSCTGTAYTCAANQCQTGGSCLGDGTCSFTNKAPGTACDDHNDGTIGETCSNGVCGNPTGCAAGYSSCGGICVQIGGSQCCVDSDCHTPSREGKQVCDTTTHTCGGTPTCAAGFTACGSDCIPQGACCSNTDCPSGLSCIGNSCSLSCGAGLQACGASCVQTGAQVCCPSDNI